MSKLSYGYSDHSLPFSLPLISGRLLFSEPKRGDVAVFKLPSDNKTDYIKRLIGLPGDRIQVIGGILHINGKPVKRRKVGDFVTGGPVLYLETLPNARSHYILEESDRGPNDNTDVFTVPEGHYFAMGDNRDRSRDSRFRDGVGFIPAKNLVGRAEFLFFSIEGSAWQIWRWPWAIRYGRLFEGIE